MQKSQESALLSALPRNESTELRRWLPSARCVLSLPLTFKPCKPGFPIITHFPIISPHFTRFVGLPLPINGGKPLAASSQNGQALEGTGQTPGGIFVAVKL